MIWFKQKLVHILGLTLLLAMLSMPTAGAANVQVIAENVHQRPATPLVGLADSWLILTDCNGGGSQSGCGGG